MIYFRNSFQAGMKIYIWVMGANDKQESHLGSEWAVLVTEGIDKKELQKWKLVPCAPYRSEVGYSLHVQSRGQKQFVLF